VTAAIESAEARIAAIDAKFATPGYFDATDPESIRELTAERDRLQQQVDRLVEEWEHVERQLAAGN
jgi:sugar-specific transcriptional regulator TrmB